MIEPGIVNLGNKTRLTIAGASFMISLFYRNRRISFTRRKLTTRQIAVIAMGVALITVCSWISIPAAIPFTLQTFAVCLVTAVFGLRLGLWTVACYILLGAVGAPVFSGFKGGFAALLGIPGGYIIGFLFTALVVGLAVGKLGRKLPVLIVSMVLGIILCYTFGTAWFVAVYMRNSGPIGVGTALAWCVIPYLIPDAVKIVLAAFLTLRLYPIFEKGSRQ